jgi:hypothetical protein
MLLIPSVLHLSNVEYNLDPNSEVSWTGNVSASSSTESKGRTLKGNGAVKASWITLKDLQKVFWCVAAFFNVAVNLYFTAAFIATFNIV